jgi:hypothetical protein
MDKPTPADFPRSGPPRSPFVAWLMSLPLDEVYEVPDEFAGIRSNNVTGNNSPLTKAGRRAHFATLKGKRWVYVDERNT